jgi:hypothetical protein
MEATRAGGAIPARSLADLRVVVETNGSRGNRMGESRAAVL